MILWLALACTAIGLIILAWQALVRRAWRARVLNWMARSIGFSRMGGETDEEMRERILRCYRAPGPTKDEVIDVFACAAGLPKRYVTLRTEPGVVVFEVQARWLLMRATRLESGRKAVQRILPVSLWVRLVKRWRWL